ncbi:MAG: hypothetical protein HLUCCA11_17850 [Phormidesmis priestleyi Ana]|uniref:Glycosyltransferase n=1 Tax=Phormidesmis priestleyi Ana TaxID=1666911 RepID=A0A0P8BXE0_9CYAN|nr:MAG: hypothetical protein HLUCCA11_17850 [Phormidesmis priestleyi Ana]
MHSIIQIIPNFPPQISGVGDYACCLAQQMRQEFAIQTHFIVGDPSWSGPSDLDGFPVSRLDRRSATALQTLLNQQPDSIVFLHYVGYGYAKRGCPSWLINGLQHWQQYTPDVSLITMFHEVYAAGCPPWTSAFWVFPLQKYLSARLAHLSDSLLTSKHLYAKILHNLAPQHHSISVLPIFSTVGEPNEPPLLNNRRKQLIIFGGATNRYQVYQSAMPILSQVCQLLKIEAIIDIGPELMSIPETVSDVPVIAMGQLTAAKISQLLLQSTVGLLSYNPDYLAKSTILAAYCAHGLLSINCKHSTTEVDGLIPGIHYLVASNLDDGQVSDAEMQAIANNAHNWYQDHTLSAHARAMVHQLYERT